VGGDSHSMAVSLKLVTQGNEWLDIAATTNHLNNDVELHPKRCRWLFGV
jgi:hypothetical protein